jgi:hypothetical protein
LALTIERVEGDAENTYVSLSRSRPEHPRTPNKKAFKKGQHKEEEEDETEEIDHEVEVESAKKGDRSVRTKRTQAQKKRKGTVSSDEEPPRKKRKIDKRDSKKEKGTINGQVKQQQVVVKPLDPWVGLHCCQWSRNVETHDWIAYGGYSGFLIVRKLKWDT